jgi:hypothetical protein
MLPAGARERATLKETAPLGAVRHDYVMRYAS